MDHCPYEAYHAEKPAYRVLWGHAGNYHCAHGRVAYREQDILCPEGVDGNVRVRQVQDQKQKAQSGQSHGECPHRPGEPGGGAAAHPIDSSSLSPCSFCHNPTLQHYRLSSVTKALRGAVVSELLRIHLPRLYEKWFSEGISLL